MAAAIKFSISVPQANLDKLNEIAELEDRKRNWIINKAIEIYLEDYEKEVKK